MRAFLLTVLLAGASTSMFADDWTKQWAVSGSPEFHVNAGDGAVVMTTGGGGRIEAHVTTKGWTIGSGQVNIVERQDGSRVELEVKVPKTHGDWGQRSIEIEVRVPSGTSSFVQTGDGAIRVSGVHGSINARSGDGNIEAMDVDGSLIVHTGDGAVQVRGRVDQLDVTTGDGSIEAELTAGSKLGSGSAVHTGDGQVTLRLPGDLNADLDAHTGDGSITVDMPITLDGGLKQEHDVHGKINGGGETLTIRTGDGSIHIQRS